MFWAGSYMARHGELSGIYDNYYVSQLRRCVLPARQKGHVWLYPPPFLLMSFAPVSPAVFGLSGPCGSLVTLSCLFW